MPAASAASVCNFIIDQAPGLIFLRSAYEAHRPRPAKSSARPLPICRQPAVAAPLAHHMPEAGEGEMVTADQRLVGGCAVEEGNACLCCQRHVLIESERPLRMLEADRGVDHGVGGK